MKIRALVLAAIIPLVLAGIATGLLNHVPDTVMLPVLGPVSLEAHARGLTTVAWASVVPLFIVIRKSLLKEGHVDTSPGQAGSFWTLGLTIGALLLCLEIVLVTNVRMAAMVSDAELQRVLGDKYEQGIGQAVTMPVSMLFVASMVIASLAAGWIIHERAVRFSFVATLIASLTLGIGSEIYSLLLAWVEPLRFLFQAAFTIGIVWLAMTAGYLSRFVIATIARIAISLPGTRKRASRRPTPSARSIWSSGG